MSQCVGKLRASNLCQERIDDSGSDDEDFANNGAAQDVYAGGHAGYCRGGVLERSFARSWLLKFKRKTCYTGKVRDDMFSHMKCS